MSTLSPTHETPTEHDRRLRRACEPMPVNYFKAIKAVFYTAVMLLVSWLALRFGADATIVFSGFVVFFIVYITETKDVEFAGLVSATFYRSDPAPEEDDD